jgi:hypothetical protein
MKISGTVANAKNQALSEYDVVAYHGDVNLKKERRLRTAKTDESGAYSLSFGLAQYPLGVNVRVAVLDEDSNELWSSPIHYNATSDLVIDAAIPDTALGITEYERLTAEITPLLQGAQLSELLPTQIAYLAGRSGISDGDLARLVSAALMHADLPEVSEEAFFALLSQGLPTTVPALVALTDNEWTAALEAAARGNVIAPPTKAKAAAVVAALNARKATETLDASSPAGNGVASFATVALKKHASRNKIAHLAVRHDGINDAFWRAVARDRSITAAERNRLKSYAEVSEVVGNDPELLRLVATHLTDLGEKVSAAALTYVDDGTLAKLMEEAARSNGDALLAAVGAKGFKAVADARARAVTADVAAAFPTEALRAELKAAPKTSYFGRYKTGLERFLDRNGGFDLRGDLFSVFNPPDGSDPFRGIPDKEAVKERLGTIVRLYRALPDPRTTDRASSDSVPSGPLAAIGTLTKNGYDSSSAISGTPRAQFIEEIAETEQDSAYWGQVHDRATAVRDIAWLKGVELLHQYRQPFEVMHRLRDAPETAEEEAEDGAADWRTLFGSLDMCDCEACASITSPAAYLADLFNFLGTELATAQSSPYQVLVARRPDIPHILLNCDNANRAVPSIDLVNELLEDEVLRSKGIEPVWAPHKRVRLDFGPADLDAAASESALVALGPKKKLVRVLNKALPGYRFDSDVDASVITRGKKHGERWHVFSQGWLIELSWPGKGQRIDVDYVSRQTYGTERELAANPAFRNPRATGQLDAAKFPLSLPPALPLLETRLFLSHLQVPREHLIRLLAPQDIDGWSIEYLQLSAAEAELIASPQAIAPAEAWGFHSAIVTTDDILVDPADSTRLLTGNWAELLRRVDVLIARARISYVELLDLLVTDFLNPPVLNGIRPISIRSVDESDPATCELSKLRIEGSLGTHEDLIFTSHLQPGHGDIGAPGDFLDRLVRFLRLMRRTGWTARELDVAIRQVHPGVLDGTTLASLAIVKSAQNALHLSHSDACAVVGALDTRRYIDHASNGQPVIPSQYEQLFQNRAITNPVDRNFSLDDAADELRNTARSPSDGAATIAAAFRISETEVIALAATAGITTLTLQALSDLYRRVLFARGFKLTIAEMIWLERIAGALPTIDQIPEFFERVERLLDSKLSVADAFFLLWGDDAGTAYLRPGTDEIAQTLGDLRSELQRIDEEHPIPDPVDSDGALLRRRFGELDWGEPLIDELLGAITDTKVYSVPLTGLPSAVGKLLAAGSGEPVSVPLDPAVSVPSRVNDLVAYDPDSQRLQAVHTLSREDRKRLLRASTDSSYWSAVELLFALGKLSYQRDTLSCRGLLPAAGVTELDQLAHTQRYHDALKELADHQRQVLTRKLRYCSLPVYEIDLDTTTLDLPPELATYVHYDAARKKLVIRGQLTDAQDAALQQGATPPLPVGVVQALPTAPGTGAAPINAAELRDLLPTAGAVDALFDPPVSAKMPATTAEIADDLLAELTPYARDVLRRQAVVVALSTAFGLATTITKELIERRLPSSTGLPRMTDAFLTLAASDPRAPVDQSQYPEVFDDYLRLSKVALLFERLQVDVNQVPWVFDYAAKAGWLNAASVTSGPAAGGAGLKELTELVRLFSIADRPPYSVQLIDDLLRRANGGTATLDDLLASLHEHSNWRKEDLKQVCSVLSVSNASDLISATALAELREALQATGQLGARVREALQLTQRTIGDEEAVLAKSLAKSKHDWDRWLEIVMPINDTLREARRAALVDFLVVHPRRTAGSGRPLWHDVNSLYAYLLVDVQMSACMVTSRIRFALSSAQLFVQRCLMNLESRISVSDDPFVRAHWNEWDAWRRLYRVWEANRKVFLYPEDWIEPELRDDKTPFYKELEGELLQNEVTRETAEAAFLNYLQRLDQVGKLEVMGIFIEDERAPSNAPNADALKRTLHVVARTYGDPRQWFYRTLTTTREWHEGVWSPWEKIDADVAGDHVLPVVWNHHLYLFWALFEQRADKPTTQERLDKDNPREPRNRWYVKFASSERKQGKWSPKRVSKPLRTRVVESDDHTFEEADFSFKTEVADSAIVIKCYGPVFYGAETTEGSPQREGQPLGHAKGASVIWFLDKNGQLGDTSLTIFVYSTDGRKLLTLDSRDGGRVDVWNNFGVSDQWKQTDIEIRVATKPTQSVVVLKPLQLVPASPPSVDWWDERRYSDGAHADPLLAQIQIVDGVISAPPSNNPPSNGSGSTISTFSGPPSVNLPGVTSSITERIGHFVFVDCQGELTPASETSPERIPGLEVGSVRQDTHLRGMMYVAKAGERSFLGETLKTTKGGRFRILMPHQRVEPDTAQPFFFQDDLHAYLVTLPQAAAYQAKGVDSGAPAPPRQYRFDVFYHPYVCDFIGRVNRKGIDELLTLQTQALDDKGAAFIDGYSPSTRTQLYRWNASGDRLPITREYVDFERSGSYSVYNWELFFHIPLFIASKLNANQRFKEARDWLHFIFDPTTRPGAFRPGAAQKPTQRFWNCRPFWETEGRDIHSINDLLRGAEDLSDQYAEWRREPFKPYVIARLRLTAFMQSVVMRYLDNLLDWGDQQFSFFTMESTNEATLLYTLAADILGRMPEKIPARARPALQTYLSMQTQAAAPAGQSSDAWRNFSDLMVAIEAYVAPAGPPVGVGTGSALGRMWAFCVPSNGNLLEYWQRVADRLFKLRHCRDTEGVERKIPLWDPPIDPALLVRAAAAGVDLRSVLSDINAALPNYRFTAMLPKAMELCNEVKNFGAALLSTLEKKDGEALARLRSRHELELLQAVRTVKSNQLAESQALRSAAEKSKVTVEARRDHFRDIPFIIQEEQAGLALAGSAVTQEIVAAVSDTLAAIAAWVPQFASGTSGFYSSPVLVTSYGGEQMSRGASAAASQARSIAAVLATGSSIAQTVGSFMRRRDEWKLQETLANRELDQIEQQIEAATVREAIAQAELDNHDRQTEQSKAVDEYLRSKYTNQELYGWLQGQLSGLYFQAYKLAFDVARKTERAFRYELALEDSNFVQFGYWDSLKKGLLAGERLQNDLRRMESAYLDQNRREFEITKHVSLAALNPAALIALKAAGACEVDLPEWLFDMDYPGHYMRRIKSVSLSIPCVVGRYTNVNCSLTQSFSKVRRNTHAADYDDPAHFHENYGSAQTIVTSTARQDSGLFELNFRDERYLPFEGTGAVSRWRIELPQAANQFDVGTVSDVILHLHYTARDGGAALREAARTSVKNKLRKGRRLFDTRSDFASQWFRFKNPEAGQSPELRLDVGDLMFPFHSRHDSIKIKSLELICSVDEKTTAPITLTLKMGSKSPDYVLVAGSAPGSLRSQEKSFEATLGAVVISGQATAVAAVEELLLLCHYELQP